MYKCPECGHSHKAWPLDKLCYDCRKTKEKAERPSAAASCSRSDTPRTDAEEYLEWEDYDMNRHSSPMDCGIIGRAVPSEFARTMERRLAIIAADASVIHEEWLESQPEGIRLIITNIRRHANLRENSRNAGDPAREINL